MKLAKPEKILGLIFDCDLKFDGHIAEVQKANHILGLIRRIFNMWGEYAAIAVQLTCRTSSGVCFFSLESSIYKALSNDRECLKERKTVAGKHKE